MAPEDVATMSSPPSPNHPVELLSDALDINEHIEDASSESMASFMDSLTALAEVPHLPSELESVAEEDLIPAKSKGMSLVQRAVYEQRKAYAAAHGTTFVSGDGAPSSPPHGPAKSASNKRARGSSSDGEDAARHAPMPKADGKVRFFCKHPQCGKGYASTDAVRKHCRQRHLEWLRDLGQGCPTLYCEWVDGDVPEAVKP